MIPPATLEQIRAASDIVEIIGGYVPLKRAGANFTALCPFHKEKSPSFNVNPHKQIFYCFGCHKGGDVFTFVKEYENLPFIDAVRRLADRARIPLEFDAAPGQRQARDLKETLRTIHEQLTVRWQAALTNDAAGQIARDYLAKRHVSADAIKLFRIGYAPEKWDDTVNWAHSKNFDLALVEQAGLIVKREGGDGHYDRFRGRLMFPICDEQGRVIGFSGRVLSGDEKTAKYVNSPETPIFTKGKVIFGLDKSKRALLDTQRAVICEGQLDLIACFMGGVQNVVAPQGTALTADQARILKRYVNEVVLCFDADNAGQNAAVRSLDPLLAAGLAVRVARVPSGKDPDEFIRENGGEAFQKIIEASVGFFDFYLDRLCAQNDLATDRGRTLVMSAMALELHKINDSVIVNTYVQRIANRLGVAASAVQKELLKPVRQSTEISEEEPDAEQTLVVSTNEFAFLKLVFANDESIPWMIAHLKPEWIETTHVRTIIEERFWLHRNGLWQGISSILERIQDIRIQQLINRSVTQERVVNKDGSHYYSKRRIIREPMKDIAGMILKFRNEFIGRELMKFSQRANHPDVDKAEQEDALREILALGEWKREPLKPLGEEQ